MNEAFQHFMNQMAGTAGKAAKNAGEMARKGKKALDCKELERELAKLQRRLGILAYETLRTGEALEPAAAQKYMQEIQRIAREIKRMRPSEESQIICKKCGAHVSGDAMFCGSCGAKLE